MLFRSKLKTALKDAGVAVDAASKLTSLLTRTETGMLIQRLNSDKGLHNAKHRELTKRIQGLYKGIFVRNIKGDRDTGRDKSTGKSHRDNAQDVKGLQSRSSRSGEGQGR